MGKMENIKQENLTSQCEFVESIYVKASWDQSEGKASLNEIFALN